MSDEGTLKIRNENGEEREFSILVTFDIEAKDKSYVLFTDYSRTEDGDLRVHSATYDKTGKDLSLGEVTEPDEIEVIEDYLKQLEEDLKAGIKLA